MDIVKRSGKKEKFDPIKIENAVKAAFNSVGYSVDDDVYDEIVNSVKVWDEMSIEDIQDQVIEVLRNYDYGDVADAYLIYRYKHAQARKLVEEKKKFIAKYKAASNTANATIDDNSNVASKNIGILNAEGHKEENILVNRGMVIDKLKELFPDFDSKQYIKDLEHHIIYKHDESTFMGAIAPYCCSISMYPFLNNGIKGLGGLSAKPKNLDSFCGMFINLMFAVAGQFAGAVATPEFLMYFDYFAKKEWGDLYFEKPDIIITNEHDLRQMTIRKKIRQYFQQVVYSVNQPAAARGMQAVFWNVAYFDKPFFEAMFENFMFPDFTAPQWDSLNWLQKEFMQWFNE